MFCLIIMYVYKFNIPNNERATIASFVKDFCAKNAYSVLDLTVGVPNELSAYVHFSQMFFLYILMRFGSL